MRAPILAVGLVATAITVPVAIEVFIFFSIDHSEPISFVLAGAAIAGPLFGAIAGAKSARWGPLITGCALGIVILIGMASTFLRPLGADSTVPLQHLV